MTTLLSQLDSFILEAKISLDSANQVLKPFSESLLLEEKESSVINKICIYYILKHYPYTEENFTKFLSTRRFGNMKNVNIVKSEMESGNYIKYLENPAATNGTSPIALEYFRFLLEINKQETDKMRDEIMELIHLDDWRWLQIDGYKYLPLVAYILYHHDAILDTDDKQNICTTFQLIADPVEHSMPDISQELINKLNGISSNFNFYKIKAPNDFTKLFNSMVRDVNDHLKYSQFESFDVEQLIGNSSVVSFTVVKASVYSDVMDRIKNDETLFNDFSISPTPEGYTAHKCLVSKDVRDLIEDPKDGKTYTIWCVALSKNQFDSSTGNGGLFYVFLHKDYKKWTIDQYDFWERYSYAKSMIAVALGREGEIKSIWSRLNNTGSFMKKTQLEELTGIRFSELSLTREEDPFLPLKSNLGNFKISDDGLTLEGSPNSRVNVLLIPNGIQKINRSAFSGFNQLVSVFLPASVVSIGDKAFRVCKNLRTVRFNSGLKSVMAHAFFGCENLESAILPDGLTTLGDAVFRECSGLRTLRLPDGLTDTPNFMCVGCTSLQAIELPSTLKKMLHCSFYGCTSLKEVVIPDSVEMIDVGVFSNCTSLESIKFPSRLRTILSGSFYGCTSLRELTIPDSVTEIHRNAFSLCTSLKTVSVSSNTVVNSGSFPSNTQVNVRGSEPDYSNPKVSRKKKANEE